MKQNKNQKQKLLQISCIEIQNLLTLSINVTQLLLLFVFFLNFCFFFKFVTNKMATCRLISEIINIPHLKINEGQTLVIGRNRECKIKQLNCSRNYCTVQMKENKKLLVRYKNGVTNYLNTGQIIKGPGFCYRIKIMMETCQSLSTQIDNTDDHSSILWSEDPIKNILIGKFRAGGKSSPLIAAFDFDFTLVSPKSGKAFPTSADDWKLVDSHIPQFISNVIEKGYRFVIVSNQMGITKGKTNVSEVKKRLNDSVKAIGAPCLVLVSTHDDIYRKPRIGLWSHLVETEQPLVNVDYIKSFYVGDAAGRKKSSIHKGDHSFVDLYFALNAGLNFMVPEHFFKIAKNFTLNSSVPNMASSFLNKDCFKPNEQILENEDLYILKNLSTQQKLADLKSIVSVEKSKQHCIIFCGMSASGKSSFYSKHLKPLNYVYISRDVLNSMEKCESVVRKTFEQGKNCVIDNTNIDKASRARWIQLCKTYNVVSFIFYFKLPLNHVLHNNVFRKLCGKQQNISTILIYTQNKKLEEPTDEENPGQIYLVNNVHFDFLDQSQKKLYYMYLNEK